MELETINKLYLELSQFATAKTVREIRLEQALKKICDTMMTISLIGHTNNYDWNEDPEFLTRVEGEIFEMITLILKEKLSYI